MTTNLLKTSDGGQSFVDLDTVLVTKTELQGKYDQLPAEIKARFPEYGPIEGTLWTWGSNAQGQLSSGGTPSQRSSPAQVGSLSNWSPVSVSAYTGASVKPDGTLWVWGMNNLGQLGVGDVTQKNSPVQVGTLADWKSVSVNGDWALAVKTNGTLWAWGNNNYGQLGLGDVVNRSSPVQVGALTDWASVTAGGYHGLALKKSGTLWAWGMGWWGQLGNGSTSASYSSPLQVGSLTDWASIPTSVVHTNHVIKKDGTLWAWGYNTDTGCELGLGIRPSGTASYVLSPTKVGALTDWKSVSSSNYHSVATKTDGTLWTWGSNGYGACGVGHNYLVPYPAQIGALMSWTQASAGGLSSAALKTDGTLWTWGSNAQGQLGQGTRTNRSSPLQVGALTTWKSVSVSFLFMAAIK